MTTTLQPDPIERALGELSDRIRRARQSSGLTLAEFGKRCGLSASAIQKIESQSMAPSVAVVMKIAAGLGVHVGDLLAPPEVILADLAVQRSDEHTKLPGNDDLRCYRLSATIENADLEAWRIILAPQTHAMMARPLRTYEQIVFCERGRVEIELDHAKYVLDAGDTLHCLDKQLYACANLVDTESAYVICGRFPHGPPYSRAKTR
jgi:transcriptional regulator with XRE-family HTH domain